MPSHTTSSLHQALSSFLFCVLPLLQLHLETTSASPILKNTSTSTSTSTRHHQQRRVELLANRRLQKRQSSSDSDGTLLPDFALQFAPLIYLHEDEQWFPTDVKTFLTNVVPVNAARQVVNSTAPTFATLDDFPEETYLSSTSDITDLPDPSWLNSQDGKPDTTTGLSSAPVEIIVAPKDGGITDVFYFFFYAYNRGTEVLGSAFGDHLGDWEHIMIRFQDSQPQTIYLSQHDKGTAYVWDAIVKTPEGVPTAYSSYGDHASYALPGTQSYDTFLTDSTSAGTAWDTAQNYRGYLFDSTNGRFAQLDSSLSTSSSSSPSSSEQTADGSEDADETAEGVAWLTFTGYWGDQQYPDSDSRQFCLFGHCRYVSGPQGPYLKNLGRKAVCQDEEDCDIQQTL